MAVMLSCKQQSYPPEQIIARVDTDAITIDEFRLFYELDPNFGMDSTGYPALRDELDKYIDHYLAYRRARKEGLLADSTFRKIYQWELRSAMLRQLYRRKVDARISFTDQELRQAYLKFNTRLHVRHLFAPDSQEAVLLYERLQQGESFETLAKQVFHDTLLARNGGDLGWIAAGELDGAFARAALQLPRDVFSQPVKSRWGYHIIQVLERKVPMLLTEDQYQTQKRSIEKRLRLQKRKELAHQYIMDYIGKLNPQPVPQTFRRLWQALVPSQSAEQSTTPFRVMLTDELIEKASRTLSPHLKAPLIRYRGGQVTLGEYLNAMRKIPVSNRPRFKTTHQLSNHIGIWIRDELLYQQAVEEGLAKHPKVTSEVTDVLRKQSYLHYLRQEMRQVRIPEEVRTYFEKRDSTVLRRPPELRRFHTLQEWLWHRAEARVHGVLRRHPPSIEINEPLLRSESEQIDWKGRVRMFAIRKPG